MINILKLKKDDEDKYLKDKVIPQNKLIIIDIPKLTRNKDVNDVCILTINQFERDWV